MEETSGPRGPGFGEPLKGGCIQRAILKYEIRISKSETNSNDKNSKFETLRNLIRFVLFFPIHFFLFVSCDLEQPHWSVSVSVI